MTLTFKSLRYWPRSFSPKRRGNGGKMNYDKLRKELVAHLQDLDTSWAYIGMEAVPMRQDGWPSLTGKPSCPGVCLVFDSRFGPLVIACDTFNTWPQNLRAVLLTLANVKAVAATAVLTPEELYAPFGVENLHKWMNEQPFGDDLGRPRIAPKKGKPSRVRPSKDPFAPGRAASQPPPQPPTAKQTACETFGNRLEAATWLSERSGIPTSLIMDSEASYTLAYRKAARELHPDAGGAPADFRRLQNAKTCLERGAPWSC